MNYYILEESATVLLMLKLVLTKKRRNGRANGRILRFPPQALGLCIASAVVNFVRD